MVVRTVAKVVLALGGTNGGNGQGGTNGGKGRGIGDLVNTAANLASKANSGADGKVVRTWRWQRRC